MKNEIREMKEAKRGSQSEDDRRLAPQVSVPLPTAVTEVSVALRAGHVITAFCPLDMDLKTKLRKKTKQNKKNKVRLMTFIQHTVVTINCL